MTRDIDIVIEIQETDTDNLLGLFDQDFYVEREAILDAAKNQGMFNIIHNIPVVIRKSVLRDRFAPDQPSSIALKFQCPEATSA